MIEIRDVGKHTREEYNPYNEDKTIYGLYIDEKPLPDDEIRISKWRDGFHVYLYDSSVGAFDEIYLNQLPSNIEAVDFNYYSDFAGFEYTVCVTKTKESTFQLSYEFELEFDNWKNLWSIKEFGEELDLHLEKTVLYPGKFQQNDETILNGFKFIFPITDHSVHIAVIRDEWMETVYDVMSQVIDCLEKKVDHTAIVSSFNFPEETRIACEQYLLYFVQFLKDLGIDANAKVHHEAGRILFSVKPSDPDEALDAIREALEIYLRLPNRVELNANLSQGTEIEVQRLLSNISHLNGQLMLAQAIIETKDTTIAAKDAHIRQLLQGDIFIQSRIEPVLPAALPDAKIEKSQDRENIIGDILYVKSVEKSGVGIDLPRLFRLMKAKFALRKQLPPAD